MSDPAPITQLLQAHRAGEAGAFDRLVAMVYEDLRRLARRQRRGNRGSTLDTTALVHEAYLKLARSNQLQARDRGHFFAVASRAMRQVFVDYAKSQRRAKRGGGAHHTGLDGHELGATQSMDAVIAVDQLLSRLVDERPRTVQVVECRWFAGLSEEETAVALQVSLSTVQREWRQAKAMLRKALAG